jgi:SAM-dependent methyltransferase
MIRQVIVLIRKPLHYARELIAAALPEGGTAVDATCGNGHDTVFLARLAGPSGSVFAFDIQPRAIEATRDKLRTGGLLERVSLIGESHAGLAAHVEGAIDAAMFNLGYLPGGDHGLVTKPESTMDALSAILERLKPGGVVTLVVYTGHAGGMDEYRALRDYLSRLPQLEYSVLEYGLINQANHPPLLLAVSRL